MKKIWKNDAEYTLFDKLQGAWYCVENIVSKVKL